MKALILAAGLGTRLLPYTKNRPKSLFPIAGRPLLDIIIHNLHHAGCNGVMINTHHLHEKIQAHITRQTYPIPVFTRHEPKILGTGGAIKNVADFWDDAPFMVINSDIVTDIDLKKVYAFHQSHLHPATLVLYDDPSFNSVEIDGHGFITDFYERPSPPALLPAGESNHNLLRPSEPAPASEHTLCNQNSRILTFTGIQVLDPGILEYIPDQEFSSSIDLYRKLLSGGQKLHAFIAQQYSWKDIGTPERYRDAAFEHMAPEAFRRAFTDFPSQTITRSRLKGDGSDRNWYRLTTEHGSLIMVDHGLRQTPTSNEADAFINIGRHLYDRKLPVPRIYLEDSFSGMVFLEDLGDTTLQKLVQQAENANDIVTYYESVIDLLIKLSIEGAKGFDSTWAYQTDRYDRQVIIEKECRYFVEAFLSGYLEMKVTFALFEDEFSLLADRALECSYNGCMHRDLQSRNIMVRHNRFYFIDFQGARLGPIQYDLASILIDPYVALSAPVQNQLLDYCVASLALETAVDPETFRNGYRYCSVTRNLQILGAFSYLSRSKGKTYFEQYIPVALRSLKDRLAALDPSDVPTLTSVVEKIG